MYSSTGGLTGTAYSSSIAISQVSLINLGYSALSSASALCGGFLVTGGNE